MPQSDHVEALWTRSLDSALRSGSIDPGDRVVLTAGTAVNLPGSTNVIKVDVAEAMPAGAYSIPEVQQLVATLVASKPGGRVAEIGTSYGDGAKAIVAVLPPG